MHGISTRSLLISHAAAPILFLLLAAIGYFVVEVTLKVLLGISLAEAHHVLQSNIPFKDAFAASVVALSAAGAGWIAAKTSNIRPLVHGAFSAAAFFLLFFYSTVHDIFQVPDNVAFRLQSLYKLSQLAVPLFGVIGASIVALTGPSRASDRDA